MTRWMTAIAAAWVLLVVARPSLGAGPGAVETLAPADRVEAAEGGARVGPEMIAHAPAADETDLGERLPLWSVLPFVGILLSIAVFPLVAPRFWHHHFPKVSAAWALLFAIPFVIAFGHEALHEIAHIYVVDYVPFIILLWALFTISGGIYVRGTLRGTPKVNLGILLVGTLFASWIGTTGAAMVTVRPLLRANANRRHRAHTVVFFIFLVANIGGSLTPLGDPPLFLGFLHGVPFFWTLFHILPDTLLSVAILSCIYYLMDSYYYRREGPRDTRVEGGERFGVEGAHNLLLLLGVVGAVLMSGTVRLGHVNVLGVHQEWQNLLRDGILIVMGLLSLKTTRRETRWERNQFTWFPILEVAYLFAGIFMTIIPALAILKAGERGAFGALVGAVNEPWHYFWATGSLSSFLDNAPTYLTFFNSALGKLGLTEPQIYEALRGHAGVVDPATLEHFVSYLTAISAGAVFMGANTYIGNAPNFMVRSIAEEQGVAMPSFFGYMLKYSIPILIPTFVLLTFVFFD